MRLFHKLISWILVLVLAAAVLPASAEQSPESAVPSPAPGSELLRLHQIDIGCGDAYLLTVGDYTVLVDCGTDSTLPIAQHVHNYPLFDYLEAVGIDHVDWKLSASTMWTCILSPTGIMTTAITWTP